MNIPKYKYLLTYRYAELIFDLNAEFCRRYDNPRSRTYDQKIQAGRSGKQNIIEAVGESDTTKKGEIKLLGISKGSYEELIGDYEDYLRLHGLLIYPKDHPKTLEFRKIATRLSHLSNLSYLGHLKEKPILPDNPTDAANFLLTLCHIETYLLDRQIKAMVEKFQREGGFTENLFSRRLKART